MALSLVGLTSTQYSGSAAGSANRGTVPPSAYGAGLVSMPSPIDNTNNLVMTGNVGGGKAFRGNVPYGSTTSFGAPLGSTSLDPFLRYSSIPEGLGNGPSDYSPFYSPTGTVPKIPPGDSGVFAPGSPRVTAGKMLSAAEPPADVIALPPVPGPQVSAGQTNAWGDKSTQAWQGLRPVPLTATPDEMRQILAGASSNPSAGKGLPARDLAFGSPSRPSTQTMQPMSAEEYRRQVDQLQRDLDRVKTSASEFEQSLRADRQSYAAALGQMPAQTTPPFATGDALRRIVLPQSQLQTQSPYPMMNPVPGQRLSLGNDGISQSQGQAWLDGRVPPAPGSALGYLDAAPPDQAAAGLSELTLVAPQKPPTGARVGAATEPRVPLYVPPAALAPSVSDETGPKDRIDAIFAPQIQMAASAAGSGSGRTVTRLPTLQRAEKTVPAFDPPAAILARSRPEAAEGVPSAATHGAAGSGPHQPSFAGGRGPPTHDSALGTPSPSQSRLVIAGAPVQPDTDLASVVKELGDGVSLPPNPAPAVGTERARITVEPAPEAVPSQAAAAPTPAVLSGGPGAAPTMKAQPKSAVPTPAPKPPRVVLPPDTPFDRYLRSAQLSMQQSQYAKAAESFSLAAGCNPKDVRPLLGRSHALFAAGEYLSSAVYLAKAIELDPGYVLQRSNLLEAVGGPDLFVQRITDLEKRAKVGDAPVLHLLLAYLYQQMGRLQEATTALQAARKGLPSSGAVELLGKVIARGPPG